MMYPVVLRFSAGQDLQHHRGNEWLSAIGRLKAGIRLAHAEANFSDLTQRLMQAEGAGISYEAARTCFLLPSNATQFSPMYRQTVTRPLGMLMASVGLVLLIAWADVAGLLLAVR